MKFYNMVIHILKLNVRIPLLHMICSMLAAKLSVKSDADPNLKYLPVFPLAAKTQNGVL